MIRSERIKLSIENREDVQQQKFQKERKRAQKKYFDDVQLKCGNYKMLSTHTQSNIRQSLRCVRTSFSSPKVCLYT